jgi:excisionase family DNA binding protein
MEEKLLSYKDVADFLQISEITLRTWVSRGRIPYTKIGKSVRFTREQIDEIVEAGARPARVKS